MVVMRRVSKRMYVMEKMEGRTSQELRNGNAWENKGEERRRCEGVTKEVENGQ